MIRAATVLVVAAFLVAGDAAAVRDTRCPSPTGFAHLAYVKAGALHVLDMPACSGRVLVRRGARDPVRWSADGRFVLFSGGVVEVDGGRLWRGLEGEWSPRGHALARVTYAGGLVLGGPGIADRRLLPDGFGAHSFAFDPSGRRIAVARAFPHRRIPPRARELWAVDVASGTRRLVYRSPRQSPLLPVVRAWIGEAVLFSLTIWPGSSANLDGLPLYGVPAAGGRPRRIVDAALGYEEFLVACARGIAIAAGRDRVTTRGKRLFVAGPPRWRGRDVSRDRRRSWVAPACSADGRRIAASAGRDGMQTRFGLERRSIWVLAPGGARRRLTLPPPGRSDELPRWAGGEHGLLFVRSGPTRGEVARGLLYVIGVNGRPAERLVDLGTTTNHYGYYGWASQTDLYVPRGQSARR